MGTTDLVSSQQRDVICECPQFIFSIKIFFFAGKHPHDTEECVEAPSIIEKKKMADE